MTEKVLMTDDYQWAISGYRNGSVGVYKYNGLDDYQFSQMLTPSQKSIVSLSLASHPFYLAIAYERNEFFIYRYANTSFSPFQTLHFHSSTGRKCNYLTITNTCWSPIKMDWWKCIGSAVTPLNWPYLQETCLAGRQF